MLTERLDRGAHGVVRALLAARQVRPDGHDHRHRRAASGDRDRDVAEGHADRRLRLVHGDGHLVDRGVIEGVLATQLGEPLDEVVGLALDPGQHGSADRAVVDGVGEVVAGTGRREVDGELDVDDELLALAALVVEDPVEAPAPDPRQPDAVARHAAHRSLPKPCRASTTSSASTVATTSCTRTHHTPCRATCTVVAAVTTSRSSGGRAVSAVRPTAPRKVLREVPTTTRCPSATTSSSRREQLPVVLGVLGEPEAGVEHHGIRSHPGRDQRLDALGELAHDVGDDVVVLRPALHVAAVPAPVHRDERHRALRRPGRPSRGRRGRR